MGTRSYSFVPARIPEWLENIYKSKRNKDTPRLAFIIIKGKGWGGGGEGGAIEEPRCFLTLYWGPASQTGGCTFTSAASPSSSSGGGSAVRHLPSTSAGAPRNASFLLLRLLLLLLLLLPPPPPWGCGPGPTFHTRQDARGMRLLFRCLFSRLRRVYLRHAPGHRMM